jgi:hypothetical protein
VITKIARSPPSIYTSLSIYLSIYDVSTCTQCTSLRVARMLLAMIWPRKIDYGWKLTGAARRPRSWCSTESEMWQRVYVYVYLCTDLYRLVGAESNRRRRIGRHLLYAGSIHQCVCRLTFEFKRVTGTKKNFSPSSTQDWFTYLRVFLRLVSAS